MASLARDQGKKSIALYFPGQVPTDAGLKAIKRRAVLLSRRTKSRRVILGCRQCCSEPLGGFCPGTKPDRRKTGTNRHPWYKRPLSLNDKSSSAESDFNRLLALLQDSTGWILFIIRSLLSAAASLAGCLFIISRNMPTITTILEKIRLN